MVINIIGDFLIKGLCIKYVGGGWRVFAGAMKYFRHILMSHEIFLKMFDGPQNIFYILFW